MTLNSIKMGITLFYFENFLDEMKIKWGDYPTVGFFANIAFDQLEI